MQISHTRPSKESGASKKFIQVWFAHIKFLLEYKQDIGEKWKNHWFVRYFLQDENRDEKTKARKKITWKTFCQIASCPVNASGKLIPWRAIQSISFSHLSQSHQANVSSRNQIKEKITSNLLKEKFQGLNFEIANT